MRAKQNINWKSVPYVVVDTSALLAYFFDEPGVVDLETIRKKIAIPFMALCEFHYVITKYKGKVTADQCFGLVKSWEVSVLHSNEENILAASRIKDQYGLGIGDSFIAGVSLCERIPLLTYDTDFLPLSNEIKILGLVT